MAADRVGAANVSPDQPLLAIAGVSKYFGGVRAVEDVTVSIRRGEIMSVIGPNGAGKTSLLNMVSGFYRPTSGTIALEGRDITHRRPSEIAALGGAAVPLWPDAEPDSIALMLNHAGASVVVAEDGEQVEKLVAIKDLVPRLRLVVQTAAHGMRQIEYAWLKSFEAVVDAGMSATMQCDPGDPALLHYATGSGGEVRGVTLTHAELLAAAETLVGTMDVRQSDETLAWLPMAWFGDVLTSQALALLIGFTCNCPESPETACRDLREIGPTILVAPPRIWENTLSDIETRGAQASRLKRALFAGCQVIAERAERHRQEGENVPLLLQLKLAVGEVIVCAPMRDQIGLRRLR